MSNRACLVMIVLTAAMLACGAEASQPPAVPPSPTPPPIPTPIPPILLPTPEGLASPAASPTPQPTQAGPSQPAAFIYGSARGATLGVYFLTQDGSRVSRLGLGERGPMAVWPDVSPDGTRVVFAGVQGSEMLPLGLFMADIDGGNLTQLTEGDGTHPRWSPDGTRIAYTCNNGNDVCLINADGTGWVNLTADSLRMDRYPSWTPDGRIVFMSARDVPEDGLYSEIYLMNADGTGVTRITRDGDAYNAYPDVSPDGTRIVFESDRGLLSGSEIYTIGLDGSGRQRLTTDEAWNQNPVWSPDGARILYAANFGDGNIDLYAINPDGTARTRLTQDAGEDGGLRLGHAFLPVAVEVRGLEAENSLAALPDPPRGSRRQEGMILFAANSFNCPDCLETGIYRIKPEEGAPERILDHGLYPTWAPDFTRFAYIENGELYIVNADGSNPTQMTHAYRQLSAPVWGRDRNFVVATCTPYGQYDVCLVDVRTGAIINLTEPITFDTGIPYPSWYLDKILVGPTVITTAGEVVTNLPLSGRISPDGRQIVSVVDGQLVVANVDGVNAVQITADETTKGFPVWSPDGMQFVYTVARGDGRLYLYIIQADGSAAVPLLSQPIALGPVGIPERIETYYGYSWEP